MHPLKPLATGLLLAASLATAHAADSQPSLWSLDINTTSVHTKAWARRQLNQDNPGLGIEHQFNPDWGAAGGFYRNSYRRETTYALGIWTPLRCDLPGGLTASAGLAAGFVSGYRRPEVSTEPLAGGAVLRLRTASGFGVNLLAVPNTQSGSGFIGLQLVAPL
ncbi:MAG: hypothetical protein KGL51_08065 [Betaproteobacteria bacterium]|nr:hypothetical protein [Betaproteobacteria bacterium]